MKICIGQMIFQVIFQTIQIEIGNGKRKIQRKGEKRRLAQIMFDKLKLVDLLENGKMNKIFSEIVLILKQSFIQSI